MTNSLNIELIKQRIETYRKHLLNRQFDLSQVLVCINSLSLSSISDKQEWYKKNKTKFDYIMEKTGINITRDRLDNIKQTLCLLSINSENEISILQKFLEKFNEIIRLNLEESQLLQMSNQSMVINEVCEHCRKLYMQCEYEYGLLERYNKFKEQTGIENIDFLGIDKFWSSLEQKMQQVLGPNYIKQTVLETLSALPEDDGYKIHKKTEDFKNSVAALGSCIKKHHESSKNLWEKVTKSFNNVMQECLKSLERCFQKLQLATQKSIKKKK